MVREPERVVVIGGGLAGLAAAARILEGGYSGDLLLLEKSPSLGGRTGSVDYKGRTLDLGQHMHVSGFDFYLQFLHKIGLADAIRTQPRLDVQFRDGKGREGRVKSGHLPPPAHLVSALCRFPFISLLDKLSLVGPMLPALAFDYGRDAAEVSFGDWLRRRGASQGSIQHLWNPIVVPTLNAKVDDVSLAMGMMILKRVLLDKEGGRLGRLDGPMAKIAERAGGFIENHGGTVRTSGRVETLELEEKGSHLLRLDQGSTLEADVVLSAVPGHRLEVILPEAARQKFSHHFWNLEWNSIINVHLFFEKGVMEEDFFGYLEGTAGWVFNLSRGRSDSGKHICLTISDPGSLEELEPEELVQLVKEELATPLPEIEETSLVDSVVLYQPRSTIKTSPGSYSLRPPQDPAYTGFFLAGDWTDTGWPSTMEGAVRSGYFAAREVLEYLGFQEGR